MRLSREQEVELLTKYRPYLARMVREYLSRVPLDAAVHYEDMMQEANLAFLLHIRKMREITDVYLCRLHVFAALRRYRESQFIVNIPHYRFSEYRNSFSACALTPDRESEATSGEVADELLADEFLDTLSENEHAAVELRQDGYTNREIGRKIGLKDWQITRLFQRIARLFQEYASKAEDDK